MSFTKINSGKNIKIQAAISSENTKILDKSIFLVITSLKIKKIVRTIGNPQRTVSCQMGVLAFTKATPWAIEEKLMINGMAINNPATKRVRSLFEVSKRKSQESFFLTRL